MKNYIRAGINWFGKHWRGVVVSILIAGIAALTLSLQLNSLVPGQNRFETETLNSIATFPKPWQKAVNAPYTIPAYVLGNLMNNPLQAARIVSVIYGLFATALVFTIIRFWFNARAATVGTLLFVTSSWLLHTTHQATPLILLIFGPLLLLAPLAWLLRTKQAKKTAFFVLVAAIGIAAYIPYMFWIIAAVLGLIVVFERKLLSNFKTWQIVAAGSLYGVLLLPLFISLVQHPGQLHALLGIPAILPSPEIYAKQLLYTITMIVFRSAPLPELHLGSLPMLDIFAAAMLGLGIYHFSTRIHCRRSIILLSSTVLMLILVPLSPAYQISATVLMPLVYILVIAGIVELLNQWYSYFPRNPWARNFGVSLIVIAIGFASFYHLQRYFIAWPNTPETKAVYMVKSKE